MNHRTAQPYTYGDPWLSLWQSAARAVSVPPESRMEEALSAVLPTQDLMEPVHRVYETVQRDPEIASAQFQTELEGVVEDCASLAAKFLWAETTGNTEKSHYYSDQLKKAVCDVGGWSTCVKKYLEFKAKAGRWPYRANVNPTFELKGDVIALIGDWGTGERPATNLLNEVKKLNPDVVIHLGDIYYSGTNDEARANFLEICRTVLGPRTSLFSLCGNHDMYSGGAGYYWLVDELGQRASYFSLENKDWQILAMDTGHGDRNPFTVSTNMTRLEPSEEAWLRSKITGAKPAKTILLSHHQLFSPFGAVGRIGGRAYAYNPYLYQSFGDLLQSVEWWFWGHEHTLALYSPYMNLRRGRCLGCSAVPVLLSQQSYATDRTLQTLEPSLFPEWRQDGVLQGDGTDYRHAFAILRLKNASAEYYEVPVEGHATLLCTE